jgi:drug/metabolite transporter (DMT)-like permease
MREEFILSSLVGIIFGIVNVLWKIVFISIEDFSIFSLDKWLKLIFSPTFFGLAMFTNVGVLLFFYTLRKGRTAVVTSVTSSLATLIPVIIGIFLLNENFSMIKIAITAITVSGMVILAK